MEKLQTKKMLKKKKGIRDITTEDLEPTDMIIKETGRPVFKSPAGMHSEIGVTLKMGGKFVNIPSIQDGKVLTADQLADGIKSGKFKPTGVYDEKTEAHQASRDRSDSLTSERIDGLDKPAMQKGGDVKDPKSIREILKSSDLTFKQQNEIAKHMKGRDLSDKEFNEELKGRIKRQEDINELMDYYRDEGFIIDGETKKQYKERIEKEKKLLSLQEGGLLQEGGTVDPVSGNDVPVGSTQEEVRDDIPAQLSEGEFVFPADVVRFIGLDNLMKLRQEAKAGLAKMDRMGQMGNSEEAVEDDTGEFDTDIDDIIGEIEREARMAQPEEEKTVQ